MKPSRLWAMPLLLASLMALCGCPLTPTKPDAAPAQCPSLPPVPERLMQPPPKPLQTASRIQSLLFEPVTPPTSGNASSDSK